MANNEFVRSQQYYAILLRLNRAFGWHKRLLEDELSVDGEIRRQAERCQQRCWRYANELTSLIGYFGRHYQLKTAPAVTIYHIALVTDILTSERDEADDVAKRIWSVDQLDLLQKVIEDISIAYEPAEEMSNILKGRIGEAGFRQSVSEEEAEDHNTPHGLQDSTLNAHVDLDETIVSSQDDEPDWIEQTYNQSLGSPKTTIRGNSPRSTHTDASSGKQESVWKARELAFIKDPVFSAYVDEMSHIVDVFGSPQDGVHSLSPETHRQVDKACAGTAHTNDQFMGSTDQALTLLETSADWSRPEQHDAVAEKEAYEDRPPDNSWLNTFNAMDALMQRRASDHIQGNPFRNVFGSAFEP